MTNNGGFGTNILVLDGKNWERWGALMKSLFDAQDFLELVENGYEDLAANATDVQRAAFKEQKKKDCKAFFYIQQNVDSKHFEKILKITRSKEAWDILAKYYEGNDNVKQVKLQSLRRKYELMLMEDDQRISDYISKLQFVVNQMKACGEEVLDQQVVGKIMRSLTSKFDFIVVSIQESKDVKTLKIEELQSSLEAHEMLVIERSSERSSQQALQAQTIKKDGYDKNSKQRGKGKFKKGNWGKLDEKGENSKSSAGFGNNQNTKKDFDKRKVQCYNCEKFGHYAEKCWHRKDGKRN